MSSIKPFGNHLYVSPLVFLYKIVLIIREIIFKVNPNRIYRSTLFTVSVGGIHAGGTGKTPMAELLGHFFEKHFDQNILYLSRGYRRKIKESIVVSPSEKCDWREVGDEPAMLRNKLVNSYLAVDSKKKRVLKIAEKIVLQNSTVILDDGFQHRQIARDLNILTLPANPFEDYLIPAGTMRESLNSIKRADIICIIGLKNDISTMEKSKKRVIEEYGNYNCFIFITKPSKWVNLKTGEKTSTLPKKEKCIISGIARPERFYKTIESEGINVFKSIAYPDHYEYEKSEIESVFSDFNGIILTTEKDSIRLSSLNLVNVEKIWYLTIMLRFIDDESETKFTKLVTSLYIKRYNTLRRNNEA